MSQAQTRRRPKNQKNQPRKGGNRRPAKGGRQQARKGGAPTTVMTLEEPTFEPEVPVAGTTFPEPETVESETSEGGTEGGATERDVDGQCAIWGLARDHTNVVWAQTSDATWEFACTLDSDQMKFLSRNNKKKLTVPTAENIKKAREAQEAEAKRLAAEEAAKAKDAKFAEEKKSWEAFEATFLAGLKARLDAEAPGLAPETYKALAAETGAKYAKPSGRLAKNDIKTVTNTLERDIAKEKKRVAIVEERKKYPKVKKATLDAIEKEVLDAPALTIGDFTAKADAARVEQRNLGGLTGDDAKRRWASLLGIQLYDYSKDPPFERLGKRGGFDTHYSVDLLGIAEKPGVTLATTATQLVDALLSGADRHHQLHVTLETGVRNAGGGFALPHRYYKVSGNNYDFTHSGGVDRFPDTISKASVKSHLDAAHKQIRNRLIARAKVVLDADCNP
jgi:hypothetical protein